MNDLESNLLDAETGPKRPRLVLRTKTRVDVGLWWRRRSVWLCVMDDHLLLFAIGRRRHVEKIAMADCPQTQYNPTSGELVIEPGEHLRFKRLRMSTSDSLDVLNFFKSSASTSTTHT